MYTSATTSFSHTGLSPFITGLRRWLLGLALLAVAMSAGGGRALTARGAQAAGQSGTLPPLPVLQGAAARAHLSQQGLTQGVQQAYQKARYGVHPNVQNDGGYFANNPAQAYQAGFGPRGVRLQAAAESGQGWQLGLELASVGYGARQLAVSEGRVQAQGERVELARAVTLPDGQAASLSEWFVNGAGGWSRASP